jgi:hypothetical protein
MILPRPEKAISTQCRDGAMFKQRNFHFGTPLRETIEVSRIPILDMSGVEYSARSTALQCRTSVGGADYLGKEIRAA